MTVRMATLGLGFLFASVASLAADDGLGWRVRALPDRTAASFEVRADGSVVARAEGSVAFLYRPIDPSAASMLAWRWRVDRSFQPVALDRPGDDRPLAVHVWFPPDGLFGSLKAEFAEALGYPAIGHALTYVWGGVAARGSRFPNPYLDDGVIIVLRAGDAPTATWFEESVDIEADARSAFGYVPDGPAYLAISADTDDTGASSEGTVADLRFAEPAP